MAAQRSEDHQGGELQPGAGDGHLLVEDDFYHVVRLRLSLDQRTLVLVVNTVLHVNHCILLIVIVFRIFKIPLYTAWLHRNFLFFSQKW